MCRHWYEDRRLEQALTDAVPDPGPGFEDRVLRRAVAASREAAPRSWRRPAGIATAALATVLALAALLGEPWSAAAPEPKPRMVNVVIDAKENRRDALVTVELADDLELAGYSDQRRIQWRTDLAKGKNLLALPVRARSGAQGDIRVALSYQGGAATQMRIPFGSG
ncbi:MAG: hypothetical protein ACODAC_10095 [Pseudomonadota bacterium]